MRFLSSFLPWPLALLCIAGMTLSGCFIYNHIGMEMLYKGETLPPSRFVEDIGYWDDPGADPKKHRLDLFLPVGEGWSTVVFIHGGGWDTGDKNLQFAGADIYGNIGRFFARRGIGAAVVNYRLIPQVRLPDQVADVGRAVAWVHRHISDYGGNPDRLFLMGHSAGAHLASRLAFDTSTLEAFDVASEAICGVIAVSGAAYDLTDPSSRENGGQAYMEKRFGDRDDWQHQVSSLPLLDSQAPPFLILYAGGETTGLQRQSQLLDEALREAGVSSKVVVVPGEDHARIILALSRDDKTAGPAAIDFVRSRPCE